MVKKTKQKNTPNLQEKVIGSTKCMYANCTVDEIMHA